jgi:hypothetical protein
MVTRTLKPIVPHCDRQICRATRRVSLLTKETTTSPSVVLEKGSSMGGSLTIFKQPALGGLREAKPHIATHEDEHGRDDKAQHLCHNAHLP